MKANGNNLKKILNNHSNWILSLGKTGILADFNGSNLDEANLEMANLPFAKFHLASLKNANLSGVNFRQAELLHVKLSNAKLDGADLEGANIAEGDFSFSKCTGANFCDANLEGANFEGANLVNANFTRAILRGAKFEGADLSFSEIVDANLEGANFKGAKLEATNFGGTNLDKANFEETSLKVLNIDEYLQKPNLRGNIISDSLTKETTISAPLIKNNKSEKADKDSTSDTKSSKEDLVVKLAAVNQDTIEKAIGDLIDKIKSNVQLDQVKTLCRHQHGLERIDKIDISRGDIVTHNGQLAFKLDFKISYNLCLLLDRKGNLINNSDYKA
ncbi:MAG: pentapeptide repeat-containing protein [Desulfobacteraceae bacterium]|nr:pentapeptide repeat-containing protein [Desulfobacteraceae bacterium]